MNIENAMTNLVLHYSYNFMFLNYTTLHQAWLIIISIVHIY